jgi:hypothetical protein
MIEQVFMDAAAISSFVIPTLHMLAIARMYFIPYLDNDPQYFS